MYLLQAARILIVVSLNAISGVKTASVEEIIAIALDKHFKCFSYGKLTLNIEIGAGTVKTSCKIARCIGIAASGVFTLTCTRDFNASLRDSLYFISSIETTKSVGVSPVIFSYPVLCKGRI